MLEFYPRKSMYSIKNYKRGCQWCINLSNVFDEVTKILLYNSSTAQSILETVVNILLNSFFFKHSCLEKLTIPGPHFNYTNKIQIFIYIFFKNRNYQVSNASLDPNLISNAANSSGNCAALFNDSSIKMTDCRRNFTDFNVVCQYTECFTKVPNVKCIFPFK